MQAIARKPIQKGRTEMAGPPSHGTSGGAASKRSYKTFVLPSHGVEWMIHDVDTAAQMVMDSIASDPVLTGVSRGSVSILVPGAGCSELACALHRKGFTCLTITDIEPTAVERQKSLCHALVPSPTVLHDDLLDSKIQGSFDVIVDKGCLDVFIVSKSMSANRAWGAMTSHLKSNGLAISFSMHFAEWKRIAPSHSWQALYGMYHFQRASRTRPSVKCMQQPIAYFCRKRKAQHGSLPAHAQLSGGMTLTDFSKCRKLPDGASAW